MSTVKDSIAFSNLVVVMIRSFALVIVCFCVCRFAPATASQEAVLPDGETGLWSSVVRRCGGTAGSMPRVMLADSSDFRKAARETLATRRGGNPDLSMAAISQVLAFYSPVNGMVYLRRNFVRACPLANNAGEISLVVQTIVFHEFVHAWQYQNLPIAEAEKNTNGVVLDALLEGHARFCTERFARAQKGVGWKKVEARIAARYKQMATESHSPRATGGDVSFFYVDGYRFIKALAERKPPVTIQEVFKRGLPTERQVIFPEEYLKGFKPDLLDVKPIEEVFVAPLKTGPSEASKMTTFQFVDMRLMLYRAGFTKLGIQTACRNFRGGRRITRAGEESVVLAFAPTKHDDLPVYIRRCTSDGLIRRDTWGKHGHRLEVPKPATEMADAWITPAWDDQRRRPAKAKDGKPLPPVMHAVFAGRYLYIRAEWKAAPTLDSAARKILLPFIERCRKADAECAKQFKDESGDDEWD